MTRLVMQYIFFQLKYILISIFVSSQARNYIVSMPEYEKKPFSDVFLHANPQGKYIV